jgi:hypothetical protein
MEQTHNISSVNYIFAVCANERIEREKILK